jgi:hypothetical protein
MLYTSSLGFCGICHSSWLLLSEFDLDRVSLPLWGLTVGVFSPALGELPAKPNAPDALTETGSLFQSDSNFLFSSQIIAFCLARARDDLKN